MNQKYDKEAVRGLLTGRPGTSQPLEIWVRKMSGISGYFVSYVVGWTRLRGYHGFVEHPTSQQQYTASQFILHRPGLAEQQ